jgi:methionine-rich copper-binding protein CopC
MSGPSGPVTLTGFHVMASDKSIMALVGQPLPNGRYTVRWQSAGDDGHVQKGQFAFTVRQTE